ncbi:MAG TPA: MFS transporter [Steroidobacteraceae bacterium]|nr:MFS transporter [Steroidobacteraceae bacterium]
MSLRSRLYASLPDSWRTSSTLAPFKSRIFASIWSASLISNFGSLIQAVGASWLMTSIAPTADMVALVQASTTLPIMLLSLPAGASADIWDRRLVMVIAQAMMLSVAVVLTVCAYSGLVTPWVLLSLTFLLGCGVAVYGPAWQSSVGEQVPRADLAPAVALNSLAFNLARTAGPAIGGVIVARAGPPAAFLVNAMSYVTLIVVLVLWRRPRPQRFLPPENVLNAMAAGVRYSRLSPGIRTVLIRGLMFGLLGSSIWALMPLIARDLIGGNAVTYGVLLGAFGIGAVCGALGSTSLRQRRSNELIVRASTLGFGVAAIVTAVSSWHALSMVALMLGGACWVLALSTFNVTVQTSSPRWVVGRTVAIYQMVTFGGLAVGSWLSGLAATRFGLVQCLVGSGVAMVLSTLLGRRLPLHQPEGLNLDPSRTWSGESRAQLERLIDSGPVVVTVEYRIPVDDADRFRSAMRELRRIRRRDGARRWSLMQDMAAPDIWIERYHSPNWVEHLRRHHRFTVADQEIERRVLDFHQGDEPPRVRHLIERQPGDEEGGRSAVTDPILPSGSVSLSPAGGEDV